MQPEIFQGRRGFAELGHFDTNFVKNKILPDTLKATFWMENLEKDGQNQGPFFPKSGHFFRFSQKGGGGLHLPPLVEHLLCYRTFK